MELRLAVEGNYDEEQEGGRLLAAVKGRQALVSLAALVVEPSWVGNLAYWRCVSPVCLAYLHQHLVRNIASGYLTSLALAGKCQEYWLLEDSQ